MKKTRKLRAGENAFVWLLLLFSLFVLVTAYRISGFSSVSSPGAFPMAAGFVMVVSLGLVLFGNRRLTRVDAKSVMDELRLARATILPRAFMLYTFIIICYMLLIKPLHFLPSSFLFMVVSMVSLRGSGFIKSLLISAGTIGCIYLVFQYFFRVVMP